MPQRREPRLRLDWRLEVEAGTAEDAKALREALAPESRGHHALAVEGGLLVAEGQGDTPGEALHTLDDLLACLSAGLEVLGEQR